MTIENSAGLDSVRMLKENISFYEDNRLLDKGKILITERSVDWNGEKSQFSLQYQNICLHAVSRDPYGGDANVRFPHPHLFLMVDGERVWSNGEAPVAEMGDTGMDVDSGSENSDDVGAPDFPADEEKVAFLLRFVPEDQQVLDDLYSAIAECQALNPDPDDFSEEDFEDVQEALEGEEEENAPEAENTNGTIDPENFADN